MGYATIQDANDFGLVPSALGLNVTGPQIQRALDTRSSYADGKMRARYGYENIPLPPPIDPAIIQAVVHLATYDLLALRGYDANNPSDVAVEGRFKLAIKYFDDVEKQTQHPNVAVAASNANTSPVAGPLLVSSPLQGFGPSTGRTVVG